MPRRSTRELAIRGLMLDPARLTERHEFYFDLLDRLAQWRFNTLWWHFVDDEGFALKLESHPELATPYAFTKSEMRRFIAAAARVGIEVVPEVETLGHARYITRLRQYSYLADGDRHGFNAICPSHRDTLPLLTEIIGEVAELFDSDYFHTGMDEVNLSGCRRCRTQRRGKRESWVYGEHAKAIHRIVIRCGKRMIMWADHVEKDPALLKILPKDIVLAHWQYHDVRIEQIERSLRAGFKVVCCPAMLRHGHVILPHASAATNTEQMIATARRFADHGVLGAVNTWWTPWRIIRDAGLPMAGYTGHLLAGGKTDRVAFFERFLREQFAVRSKTAATALWRLHETVPQIGELRALLFDNFGDMIQAVTLAGGSDFAARMEEIVSTTKTLARLTRKVGRNRPAYNSLVLAGRVASGCLQNGVDIHRAYRCYGAAVWLRNNGDEIETVIGRLEDVGAILGSMERRMMRLCEQVGDEWDRTRHSRDPKKAFSDISAACEDDVLLGRLVRGRGFLEHFTHEFARALAAYRRGGPFPSGVQR